MATAVRAGDGLGHGAERRVDRALELEAVRQNPDLQHLASVFARQNGSGAKWETVLLRPACCGMGANHRTTCDLIILDGQQRIATTVIILSSIRTWLKEHGLDRDAETIQQAYIGVRELGEEDLEARLVLNENNDPLFYQAIVHETPTRDVEAALKKLKRHDPTRRLAEAILLCRQKIQELADHPKEARARVRILKLLGARQVHPILLAALVRLAPREMERLLHLLEVLIVRYQLIGGGRTGRLEISCAGLAVAIYNRSVTTAAAAFLSLKDLYPTDKEFQAAFQTKHETNNRKAHYLLEKLEHQARQANRSVRGPIELEASSALTVEHILPKNPGTAWKPTLHADPTFSEEYTYRLGNLCLLTTVNSKLGQDEFAVKKAYYATSTLELTRAVGEADKWDRQEIEKRQVKLAKLAVPTWRFQ
jgi:hypothetical protein